MRWEDRAACAGADPETFFPHKSAKAAAAQTIGQFCRTCDVTEDCALARPDRGPGIWGGVWFSYDGRPSRWAEGACGTPRGYLQHLRSGEVGCGACAVSHRRGQQKRLGQQDEHDEDNERLGA
jgi:hypothetical protein